MKKLSALLLCMLLFCALFAGCMEDRGRVPASGEATPVPSPGQSPAGVPQQSPVATPIPETVPKGNRMRSPAAEMQGSGLSTWNSAYGYTMDYDAALLRVSEADGSESFRTVHSREALITLRRFRESSREELEEQLLLKLEGPWELRTAQLGAEPYRVSALRSVTEGGEHWYYILDCGEWRLLLEACLPGEGPEAKAARQALDSFRLVGETALLQLLRDVQDHFAPNAAGSGMRAVVLAGRLLDWYAETAAEPALLADGAARSAAAGAEDGEAFRANLEAVYSAALMLCGEEGPALLEGSGYQPKRQPWNEEDAQLLFTALLNAAREEKEG